MKIKIILLFFVMIPFLSHAQVTSSEKALELTSKDPAVISGRLIPEVYPWWAAEGSTLK